MNNAFAVDLAASILQTEADAIVATDREGRITYWNPGASRIFGFSAEEAVGASLDLIIPEPLRARHWSGYNQVMAGTPSRYGSGDLLAVPALTRDGRRVSVEFTITLLRDAEGDAVGMAAILRDVTTRFEEVRRLRKQVAAGSR